MSTLPLFEPRGPGQPTADGWKVPRNPDRTPVRPRDPFEVPPLDKELGGLRLVSSFGRLRALRLQWPEEFQEPAFSAQKAVFHDLLTRLARDLTVHIVAEGLAAAALPGLLAEMEIARPERLHIHPLSPTFAPDVLYYPMTMWARDGALLARAEDGREVLLLPRSFRGDGTVDEQLNRLVIQGSGAAPARLGQALPELCVRRAGLYFEGGDVIASRSAVLVGADTVATNMRELGLARTEAQEQLGRLFGLPVLVVEPQPDFHLDLGFTFLDDRTIAVCDPNWAIRLAKDMPELKPLVQITREKQVGKKYETAAAALARAGYHIVRLPGLCGRGLTTPYITYNNVLLENYQSLEGPVKRVYMPVYEVPELDGAARKVYRLHGYEVIDMPSARLCTKLWGAIRCATGELRVEEG